MATIVVAVLAMAALVLAALIAWGWGSLRREPSQPDDASPSIRPIVARVLRSFCVGIVGGAASGVLVGGFGGRLVMRVLAATSGDQAQGRITEAGETVGKITFDGTLALLIFGGMLPGIAGGVVYVAIRRWLPRTAWHAGLVFGVLLLLTMTRVVSLLDPSNKDFTFIRPSALAVAMLASIPILYGVVAGAMVERLDRGYPVLSRSPRVIAAYFPLVVLLAPSVVLAPLIVIGASIYLDRHRALAGRLAGNAVRRIVRATMAAIAAIGSVWIGSGVVDILTR